MIVAEDRDVDYRGCVRNWGHVVEENAAVVEGIGQNDRVPMYGSDDVGPRSEVLGAKYLQGTRYDHCRQNEFESSSHPGIATSRFKHSMCELANRSSHLPRGTGTTRPAERWGYASAAMRRGGKKDDCRP